MVKQSTLSFPASWRCRHCGHTFVEGYDLVRQYARMTKRAGLGISYKTLRSLLDGEIDGELAASVLSADNLFLGIDEHSFKHQELVFTITNLNQRKMPGVLEDNRIATLGETRRCKEREIGEAAQSVSRLKRVLLG